MVAQQGVELRGCVNGAAKSPYRGTQQAHNKISNTKWNPPSKAIEMEGMEQQRGKTRPVSSSPPSTHLPAGSMLAFTNSRRAATLTVLLLLLPAGFAVAFSPKPLPVAAVAPPAVLLLVPAELLLLISCWKAAAVSATDAFKTRSLGRWEGVMVIVGAEQEKA